MEIKPEWAEVAHDAYYNSATAEVGDDWRSVIAVVAPLIAAEARREALEDALVACQTEADAHRALPAPKEYEERYLGAAIGCDGCTSTIHALIAAETRRENSTKRDIPAELTSVKAAIDRQPESTKANLAGKFKMGSEG